MEAEKPHDLLYASWKSRKASGEVPVQTSRPGNFETRGVKGVSPSSCPKA